MKKLIIRKRRKVRHFLEAIFLILIWIVVMTIIILFILSYTGIYTDDLATIFLIIGFPSNDSKQWLYLLFSTSACLILPFLYRMSTGLMEEDELSEKK